MYLPQTTNCESGVKEASSGIPLLFVKPCNIRDHRDTYNINQECLGKRITFSLSRLMTKLLDLPKHHSVISTCSFLNTACYLVLPCGMKNKHGISLSKLGQIGQIPGSKYKLILISRIYSYNLS